MCWAKIKRLFDFRAKAQAEREARGKAKQEQDIEESWLKAKTRRVFMHSGQRRYHQLNMPRFQMCLDCNARAKRHHKTKTGAMYHCRCGTLISVEHPLFKKRAG